MKKCLGFLLSAILVVFLLPLQSFSQAPDTVDVPDRINGNPLGAINKFIAGDTTATGDRNNINRVYRLGREKIYLFDSAIENNYPLAVIAQEPADITHPTRPPVLVPGILADGSSPGVLFWAVDDLTLKGLYILAFRPDAPGNQWSNGWVEAVIPRGDSCRYVIDDCIFDGCGAAICSKGYFQKIYLTDNICRNGVCEATWYLGHFFLTDGMPVDTLIMTNNTSFNSGGFVNFTWAENYMLFEHNTIFTNHVNPFWAGGGTNRDMRNNIIYSPFSMGVKVTGPDYDERGWSEYDGLFNSVTSVDTLETGLISQMGITESQRYVNWQNNAYFWPKAVTDFWSQYSDSLFPVSWMNERTEAMFADDVNYPNFHMSGNLNVDPGFNQDMMALVDKMVNYCEMFRTNTMTVYRHYYPTDDPNAVYFPPAWPLTEDLSYTNTALMTAGTDGFPLGDLNWFPEKKKEWETWVTNVKKIKTETTPMEFTLNQNYPNPFNPTTTIMFNLKKGGHVSLTIHNLLGQKVKTLLDKKMTAGTHHAVWNGTNDVDNNIVSGVYYYTLETESHRATKKMVLMK